MGGVRPFTEDDIPQIIRLNRKLFPESARLTEEHQRRTLLESFLSPPWFDKGSPSLVYENNGGHILGFLGVMLRQLEFQGRAIRLAVSQHLMVEPEYRSSLAALNLLRTFLAGPQDLSMADMANKVTRKLWERLGGTTSLLHSIHWRRPLRPGKWLVEQLGKRGRYARIASHAFRPVTNIIDAASSRLRFSPFYIKRVPSLEESDSLEALHGAMSTFTSSYSLRPAYDLNSIRLLWSMLEREYRFGKLRWSIVRGKKNDIQGWYIYYSKPGGTSEVLQVGAQEDTIDNVLDQLFYQAWQEGALELSGRLDPKFMNNYSAKSCLFIPGRLWMLIHSRDGELLHTITRGDSFLSRLEGDLWLV